jgi:hypothetical protein
MSEPGKSIYLHALQVSARRIAGLDDRELNVLMEKLIKAQATKCGSPTSEIVINTQGNASDDGCDGWSAKPKITDEWLGSENTCWQFKAGTKGRPGHLSGEVAKNVPRDTLIAGGRFVVITSGSTSGKKGERARLAKLITEAEKIGIPTEKIDVMGSERLATWCNQHPAAAAYWGGYPAGLWTFDRWSNSDEHQVPWQQPAGVELEFDTRRADLEFGTGSVLHLHIYGPPGVGKTRFALELCRGAAWCNDVIYIRQAMDIRLNELIDTAATDDGAQLLVVADEVPLEQLRTLRDSVGLGNGRIRLITIGHSSTPDSNRIPSIKIEPLQRQVMAEVVRGWYPAMPPEHVDFVTGFADGYVRLARLAAAAVVFSPSMDVRGLLKRDEIRGFFDRMLGPGNRRALHVVAVLTSVGWTDDKQHEGEAVAKHLGQDWNSVRAEVNRFHDLFGIAPQGGRYRYISPKPLGTHLAVEAWNTYPDLLKSLPHILPSEDSKNAYVKRLESIASNPHAREFAREQLSFFFRIDHFFEPLTISRWAALSSADPAQAARNVLRALCDANVEVRRRIEGQARRQIVWALVRLAWNQSSFHDAVIALALLAEAENETFANSASAEFVIRFQIYLGGTAVPYMHRLEVLDELLATNRESLIRLVVNALAQAAKPDAVRLASDPVSDELPEQEWRPRTHKERFDCVETAMNRLANIAKLGIAGIGDDLVAVAKDMTAMLREKAVRKLVADFLNAVREAYPGSRETLRRTIAEIIEYERHYWKTLSADEIDTLEQLQHRFEDTSLGSRLQQHLAQAPLDQEEQIDLKPLAEELISDPDALLKHWPWLTSGDAADVWRLGEALAAVDPDGQLANKLPLLPGGGSDLRLISGYISSQRQALGDDWYEAWLTAQSNCEPKPLNLLFDVVWRCGPHPTAALLLGETIQNDEVSPAIVGRLGFGRWAQNLPLEVLDRLLRAMAETGHHETAIGMLINRINSNPSEFDHWKPLCLKLVMTPDLIRSRQMANFYWKGAASRLIPQHARDIAAAILSQHQNRDSGAPWLIAHSEAENVLRSCLERDPTGAWQAIQPYLSSPLSAEIFAIGFPSDVLAQVPPDDIRTWIAQQPEDRAPIVARFSGTDLSDDATLSSMILGEFADRETVANVFFNKYISGVFWGSLSLRWTQLAQSLSEVAARTKLSKLRRWAQKYARTLREMAEEARRREEEEEIRWR